MREAPGWPLTRSVGAGIGGHASSMFAILLRVQAWDYFALEALICFRV